MCGRYTVRDPRRCLAEFSIIENPAALEPRYNIAPSQGLWAIRATATGQPPELCLLRWGLVFSRKGNPADPRGVRPREMAMARAETVMRVSRFDPALASRRCLLLADGFYEWRRTGGRGAPHFVHRPGDAPFAMAALWQPASPLDGCAVITRPALPPVDAVHDRMPAFIAPHDRAAWLDPGFTDPSELTRMLFAPPDFELLTTGVGPRVNSPANDDAGCISPPSDAERHPEQLALF
jgi:putative SOS response-associated peptidase YedK